MKILITKLKKPLKEYKRMDYIMVSEIHSMISFTVKLKENSSIPFLDIFMEKKPDSILLCNV